MAQDLTALRRRKTASYTKSFSSEGQSPQHNSYSLISLTFDLDLHPGGELREHTDRRDGGWV